jgi:glycine cleavage system regulatory protein
MRKVTQVVTVLLLIVAVISGCANSYQAASESDMGAPSFESPAEGVRGDVSYNQGGDVALPLPEESLIVFTGNISMVVADTEATVAQIQALATGLGGRVVSSTLFQSTGNAFSGQITIRVPAGQFEQAMAQIQELAVEVRRAEQTSEDVTEEYVDLRARLQNLEATAARVRAFLDETRNVEEALAVNQELSRLESEIESHKGRIQYLESQAAFSTITVSLTPDELAQPIEVGGWRLTGTARNAVEALLNALQGLARLLVWLAIFVLPLALLILLPLALLVRYLLRRRTSRGAAVVEE